MEQLPIHIPGHNPPIPQLIKRSFTVEVLMIGTQTGVDDMLEAATEACSLEEHGFTVIAVIENEK